jgi:predicted nucleic acid-binding protein
MSTGGLAFDSSPLNYMARAGQLPLLGKLVTANDCVITRAVEDEVLRGASKHAQLYQVTAQEWIRVVDDSSMSFLQLFSEYHSRLGGGGHNIGESATLAYAELHGLTACIDDRVARRHGQDRGVRLTGTLELVCRGIRANVVTETEAVRVVDLLRDHEAFLPCDGSTFLDWARAEGLLS